MDQGSQSASPASAPRLSRWADELGLTFRIDITVISGLSDRLSGCHHLPVAGIFPRHLLTAGGATGDQTGGVEEKGV